MWGYTLEECKPYIKHREREMLNREMLIVFIKGWSGEDESGDERIGDNGRGGVIPPAAVTPKQKRTYCAMCKQAGISGCKGCEYEK